MNADGLVGSRLYFGDVQGQSRSLIFSLTEGADVSLDAAPSQDTVEADRNTL